ncbi:phosphoglycerate dehydrogenase [Staphylococcus durrellii]|uniref:phosphoglycerate dehydrogenase n=1 Tax=Staphylococcus durrellii TaxID=2781773 RepID=UPI00189E41CA|nr:phosphoglycerate dehydrogenase [Staphylococcus durrellii]MBF7016718.1 phosphoglycerate dehydrogenase [Staphylococcus durrellii]
MKAVSLIRLGEKEEKLKERLPNIEFVFTSGVDEIADQDKKDLDILFGVGKLTEDFLEECPNLKWIAWYATGVEKLPLDYLQRRNIILTNNKGAHEVQMSEFIIGYILADYKNMRTSFKNQINRHYNSRLTGKNLKGQSIMFLGTGSIAQRTAQLAKAFGVRIIGVNTTGKQVDNFDETYNMEEVEQVIGYADIVINTLPQTTKTTHLLSKRHFELMKDTALFINVGRGSVVKNEVIIEVLQNKIIRHAYLDVFENEPLSQDSKFYDIDNISITAHISGNNTEYSDEVTDIFIDNLKSFLNKDGTIENEVDISKGY